MSDIMNTEERSIIDLNQLIISPIDESKLLFEEKLQLLDAEGKLVDEVTVVVERSDQIKDAFMVYQYSQDERHLLRVQSHVLHSLDCDWEVRRIKVVDKTKLLRVTNASTKYNVFMLHVEGKGGIRKKLDISKSTLGRLLLEGPNIILLRKFACSNQSGKFTGQTINHEGEVCECEYEVECGFGEVTVRRTVDQEVLTSVLSRSGRIRRHGWSGSEWCLVSAEPYHQAESHTSLQQQASSADLEVKADQTAYFEKKQALIQLMKMYQSDHSDVQDMIADFLKELLVEKPDDVVDFADRYFSEFLGIVREPEITNDTLLDPSTSDNSNGKAHLKDSSEVDLTIK